MSRIALISRRLRGLLRMSACGPSPSPMPSLVLIAFSVSSLTSGLFWPEARRMAATNSSRIITLSSADTPFTLCVRNLP